MRHRKLLYDSQDAQLLSLISQVEKRSQSGVLPMPKLNPNGIITLSEPMEERMATAVLRLLDMLSKGGAEERLDALRALHAEIRSMTHAQYPMNTGRVLVQIMKDLVRRGGDRDHQLRLAHDFRMAATGRPAVVRNLLRRYFMLEMPETWNQAVFDNHVHDANTKGRKSPTHLIMDAWLKGIRSLTVIYYNYVLPSAAHELLSAASIMGITVRIGLLFHAPHRGRLVDLIWVPRGFASEEEFVSFLYTQEMQALMGNGRAATRWLEKRILRLARSWNGSERIRFAAMLGAEPAPLDEQEFLSFVGSGQASILHLAEFIYKKLFPLMQEKASSLAHDAADMEKSEEERAEAQKQLARLDHLTIEALLKRLNDPELFPESQWMQEACTSPDCPAILNMSPYKLLKHLWDLKSGSRVTLNLARLDATDVLELLWDCKGLITHLEMFNLKDWQNGSLEALPEINALQRAVNDSSIPRLKSLVVNMIEKEAGLGSPDQDRLRKLRIMLQNLPVLCEYYQASKLRATMGTDSTSRPGYHFGMGLAYPETLPLQARRELNRRRRGAHLILPLKTELLEQVTYTPRSPEEEDPPLTSWIRSLPGMHRFGEQKQTEWTPVSENTVVSRSGRCTSAYGRLRGLRGCVVTLGGNSNFSSNGFIALPKEEESIWEKLSYLATGPANVLRVCAGFFLAWACFMFTQPGMLAWLGAPLWFFITFLRVILQSVLGSGGLHRSSMLRWNNYVSWSDVCITLMYSGPAVLLLEPVLRVFVLEHWLGCTASNAPFTVYALLTLAYGLYKAFSHAMRGYPLKAQMIDLALTPLCVPVVLLFHWLLAGALGMLGNSPSLPLYAVIVTKIGCDAVIGFGGGIFDKENNLRRRMEDCHILLDGMLSLYSRMTSLFPERDAGSLLSDPAALKRLLDDRAPDIWQELVVNALDLMHVWYFQPRANYALSRHMRRLTAEERTVFLNMQQVLRMEKQISQMLINGLAGRGFANALSFYLSRRGEYLASVEQLAAEHPA
jgi:hypothetical protein